MGERACQGMCLMNECTLKITTSVKAMFTSVCVRVCLLVCALLIYNIIDLWCNM